MGDKNDKETFQTKFLGGKYEAILTNHTSDQI